MKCMIVHNHRKNTITVATHPAKFERIKPSARVYRNGMFPENASDNVPPVGLEQSLSSYSFVFNYGTFNPIVDGND